MAKNETIPQLEIIDCSNSVIADLIGDAEKILENIPEYADIISESRFRNIKAYGSSDEPCIQASCIFDYLFPRYLKNFDKSDSKEKDKLNSNRTRQFTRWIKNNFTDKGTYGINGDIYTAKIKTNNSDSRYYNNYVLTETGVLVALCSHSENEKLALTFRQHLIKYIRNIRKYHLEISIAEREKSINEITTQLAEEIKRGDSLDAANFSMNQKIMEQHQITNLMLNDDDPRDSDIKELHILRELLMKPLYIYVVNPEYVKTPEKKVEKKEHKKSRSKKIKMSTFGMSDDSDSPIDYESDNQPVFESAFEPEFEYDYETYNHMSITIRDLEYDPEKLYYMFVSKTKLKEAKNYKLVHTLRIYTKNDSEKTHYNMMIEIIKKGSIDEFPETFEATSDSARSQYQRYLKDKKDTIQKEEKENIVETGVKISNHHIYEISYNTLVNARNLSFTKLHKDKLSSEYRHLTSPIYF